MISTGLNLQLPLILLSVSCYVKVTPCHVRVIRESDGAVPVIHGADKPAADDDVHRNVFAQRPKLTQAPFQ
jgi:hypothetical protein